MVGRIARIEVIVTSTEAEALHLEQNLVKRHRPPFNVRLRDDKSFPYIAVTVSDEYPRVMFTRERHRRGTVYFGPYANAKKVRETLDVLNRVFQFRPCEGPKPGRHCGIPCLDFHIERCTAPCIGAISKEEYREQIDAVIEFLSGDTRSIVRSLEQRMRDASADERFEDATRYRNRLFAIQSLAERQGADRRAVGTIDVIGLAVDGDRAAVQLFPLRDGKLIDRYAFHLENVEGQDRETILEGFCLEYYTAAPSVPPQLIVPTRHDRHRGAGRVPLGVARRRGRGRALRCAARSGGSPSSLPRTLSSRSRTRRRRPSRSGCAGSRRSRACARTSISRACRYGSNASTSRTSRGVTSSRRWRSSSTRSRRRRTTGRSRYAGSMVRTTSPRWDRSSPAASRGSADRREADRFDESFSTAPNLVVIDGGKGQLAAALEAIQATSGLPRVAVIALAKREEEVFVPDRSEPIVLDRHDPGLQLLQRIRDEAHRFAVTFHRQRRDTRAFASIFDTLDGIGPARRRSILRHFGSADRFLAASQEELEAVPGLPAKTARAVYAQLHRTAGPGG